MVDQSTDVTTDDVPPRVLTFHRALLAAQTHGRFRLHRLDLPRSARKSAHRTLRDMTELGWLKHEDGSSDWYAGPLAAEYLPLTEKAQFFAVEAAPSSLDG